MDIPALLLQGVLLGLSAGASPGPLSTLVISETLRGGVGAGLRVAAAPLLTDAFVIALVMLVLVQVSDSDTVLGLVSLAGAVVLTRLAIGTWRSGPLVTGTSDAARGALLKGVITNFLSPNPYLFWLTVGGPILLEGWRADGAAGPVAFLAGFYVLLVGSKMVLAWLAGLGRGLLSGRGYLLVLKTLAVALAAFAVVFAVDAVRLLTGGAG